MMAADRSDVSFNDWLKRMVAEHYPDFGGKQRLDLPSGDYVRIPEEIEPISQQAAAPVSASRAHVAYRSGVRRRDPAR